MAGGHWTIRHTGTADADIGKILRWATQRFGEAQAPVYAQTLFSAIEALAIGGPATLGTKARDEIGKGLLTLHVARQGRKGRHFLLFRVGRDHAKGNVIELLRVLHDAMDLPRHLPPEDAAE